MYCEIYAVTLQDPKNAPYQWQVLLILVIYSGTESAAVWGKRTSWRTSS
jgi:hypothetical protein